MSSSPLINSFSGCGHFLSCDIGVSVICPHCVRAEIVTIAVLPASEWDIGYGSAFVVRRDLHDFFVFFIRSCLVFQQSQFFLLQVVQSPKRADSKNILLLRLANLLSIIISKNTSLKIFDLSLTESWNNRHGHNFGRSMDMISIWFFLKSLFCGGIKMNRSTMGEMYT